MSSVATGTLTLPDAIYEGSLVNNKPMGRGVLTFDDQSRIEGTFWNLDHVVGSGTLNLASGYRYEGAIVNYQAHGAGKILSPGSTPIFTGRFERGEVAYSQRRGTIEEQIGRNELLP